MKNKEIRVDFEKNRLYLSLNGFFSDEKVTSVVNELISEVKKLKPGYDIVNDISAFKPASREAAEEIKRAQQFVLENGVRRVIRVIGQDGIASMQFARVSKGTQGYQAAQVATIEDAEKLLEQG